MAAKIFSSFVMFFLTTSYCAPFSGTSFSTANPYPLNSTISGANIDKRGLPGNISTATKTKNETSCKGTDELSLHSQDDLKVTWDSPTGVLKVIVGAGEIVQEIIIKTNCSANEPSLIRDLSKGERELIRLMPDDSVIAGNLKPAELAAPVSVKTVVGSSHDFNINQNSNNNGNNNQLHYNPWYFFPPTTINYYAAAPPSQIIQCPNTPVYYPDWRPTV